MGGTEVGFRQSKQATNQQTRRKVPATFIGLSALRPRGSDDAKRHSPRIQMVLLYHHPTHSPFAISVIKLHFKWKFFPGLIQQV